MVRQCVRLFKSDAMFLLLSNMTGLRLHPLAPEDDDEDEDDNVEEDEKNVEEKVSFRVSTSLSKILV